MPQLKNVKHERFCTLYARGKMQNLSDGKIFVLAGGNARTVHAADQAAHRLLQREDVQRRLGELGAYAVKKAEIDTENLLSKSERVFYESVDAKEYGHANKALELQGKLSGTLVDRIELDASITFRDVKSVDDVAAEMLRMFGTLDELRAFQADILARAEALAAAGATLVNGAVLVNGAGVKIQTEEKAE